MEVKKQERAYSMLIRFKSIKVDIFLIEERRTNLFGEGVFLKRENKNHSLYVSGFDVDFCQVSCLLKNSKNKEANENRGERVISKDHKFNSTDCIRRSITESE